LAVPSASGNEEELTDHPLLFFFVKRSGGEKESLTKLEKKLERAKVISSDKVPANLITMNSKVRIKKLDTRKEMTFQIVFPGDAKWYENRISVLAPVGMALIGYEAGDTVCWPVPAGIKKVRIEELLYQPEAVGDVYL
jgi:regulator of nucleoside diphosphate kinase